MTTHALSPRALARRPRLIASVNPDDETRVVRPAEPADETRTVPPTRPPDADETRAVAPAPPEPPPGAELAPGSVFAGFAIEAEIARGQMGVVYRARRIRLDRVEALKVIAPRYAADADFRARFRREAMNAAIADHPHVVRVYDADEQDGRLFIAMQLVDGDDLRDRLAASGPLPPRIAVEITNQVASALDAAHANGLIHRDVKPGNILLAGPPEAPVAYLGDFGVSRQVATPSDLTEPGSLVGTPYYTAPEQELGRPVDHRADIYSLGCVLFEMLAGRKPFTGGSVTAVAVAHVQQPPPSIRDADPGLAAFDPVLAKAMAKEPGERYQSAGQLAAAAEVALGAGTAPAPAPAPAPARPRSAKPAARRRRQPRVVAGQAVGVLACVALALTLMRSHRFLAYDDQAMTSLWKATRHHPQTSPNRVDYFVLIGLVALAFELLALSAGFLRRTLTFLATVAALVAIAELLRFKFGIGIGRHWDRPDDTGGGYWRSLVFACLVAAGAVVAMSAPAEARERTR